MLSIAQPNADCGEKKQPLTTWVCPHEFAQLNALIRLGVATDMSELLRGSGRVTTRIIQQFPVLAKDISHICNVCDRRESVNPFPITNQELGYYTTFLGDRQISSLTYCEQGALLHWRHIQDRAAHMAELMGERLGESLREAEGRRA
jgi:hypothetical protein